MAITEIKAFDCDRKALGTTVEELGRNAQFTVPVVVRCNRIERTRAKVDNWGMTLLLETDDELVDAQQLESWLDIARRRIGLGDWQPEKSGDYGRFEVVKIERVVA